MAGVGLRVQVDDREVRSVLRGLRRRLDDMRPVMDEIGGEMVLETQQSFQRESAPDGTRWPRSLRARARAAGRPDATGTPYTGRDTLQLYDSLTHRAGQDYVEWGSSVQHAAHFHFGARLAPRRIYARRASALRYYVGGRPRFRRWVDFPGAVIPPRPFLGFEAGQQRVALSILRRWLRRATRRGSA